MKSRTLAIATALGILACSALSLSAQKKSAVSGPAVFVQDKGRFTINLDGQTVGHEEFEIAPSGAGWRSKGLSEIKPPQGAASKISGTLTLQPDGAPISYEWTAQAEKTNGAEKSAKKTTSKKKAAKPVAKANARPAGKSKAKEPELAGE